MTGVFREAFWQEVALTCSMKAEERVKERRAWWEQRVHRGGRACRRQI